MFDNIQPILALVLALSGIGIVMDQIRPFIGIRLSIPVAVVIAVALEGGAYLLDNKVTSVVVFSLLMVIGVQMYLAQAREDYETRRKRDGA